MIRCSEATIVLSAVAESSKKHWKNVLTEIMCIKCSDVIQ